MYIFLVNAKLDRLNIAESMNLVSVAGFLLVSRVREISFVPGPPIGWKYLQISRQPKEKK